jgi:3-oxoacyl-(acyl-carrier-protein) synthase III
LEIYILRQLVVQTEATMIPSVRFRIAGFGVSLPSHIVANTDLANELGVDPAWIYKRCGIRGRRVAGQETTRSLGVAAARAALEMAPDVTPGIVICSTFTPEHLLCPTSPVIASDLGLLHAGAFDLNAACSGGVIGLLCSLTYLASGAADAVLLVATDTTTKFLRPDDVQTRVLFGDGAAALLLVPGDEGDFSMRALTIGSDGAGSRFFRARRDPPNGNTVEMDGRAMFRFAVERGFFLMDGLCLQAGLRLDQVEKVLVHQANLRIIQSLQERTGIAPERWIVDLEETGNLGGASILFALANSIRHGQLEPKDRLLIAGFGAGLTWAGMLVECGRMGHRANQSPVIVPCATCEA